LFTKEKSLLRAARQGNLKRITLLLDEGVDVNCIAEDSATRDEITPVQGAAIKGKIEALGLLLARGANLDIRSINYKRTAIMFAILNNQQNTAVWLIQRNVDLELDDNRGRFPVHHAVSCENRLAFDLLLKMKVNVDAINHEGESPLHIAAFNGRLDMVKNLLKCGALIELQDEQGRTPLMRATYHAKSIKVVEFLLDQGANPKISENRGYTPLHGAALMGNFDALKILLSFGADIGVSSENGLTPLHSAALGDAPTVIRYLLGKGGNIEACTSYGRTPLHYAAGSGNINAIRALISFGANRNAVDDSGRTPLELFYDESYDYGECLNEEGRHQIIELLTPAFPSILSWLDRLLR